MEQSGVVANTSADDQKHPYAGIKSREERALRRKVDLLFLPRAFASLMRMLIR
jgi:hypothetical protein